MERGETMSPKINEGIEYTKMGILQIGFYYGTEGKVLHVYQDMSYNFKVQNNYEVEKMIQDEFHLIDQCTTDPEQNSMYLECTDVQTMSEFIKYIEEKTRLEVKKEEWYQYQTKALIWEII